MQRHGKVFTKEEKKSRVLITNIICMILTVILTAVLISQITMRSALKNKELTNAVRSIDYTKITVVNGEEKMPFTTYINDYYVTCPSVTDEDIDALLKQSTASDFLTSKFSELAQYILGGSYKIPSVTPQEIADELDINKDMIYSNSPVRFVSEDHAELIAALEGPLNSFNMSLSESKEISLLRFFCSIAVLILTAVLLMLTLTAWGVLLSRFTEKTYPAIRNFSISAAAASAVLMIIYSIMSSDPAKIMKKFEAVDFSEPVKEIFLHNIFIACIPFIAALVIFSFSIFYMIHDKKSYAAQKKDNFSHSDEKQKKEILSELHRDEKNDDTETVYQSENNILSGISDNSESQIDDNSEKNGDVEEIINSVQAEKSLPDKEADNTENAYDFDPEAENINDYNQKPEGDIVMPEINSAGAIPANGRKCPHCGKINLSRNLFCSECGKLLE